jgi:hypothetical protein
MDGRMHLSNESILNVALVNPRARKWILEKVKEEAEKVLRAIEVLESQLPLSVSPQTRRSE